uniref:CHORD domain-containing protein n=1 Tax=Chaetoceros debilis TaxID=122233 RepID=A0A7S3Q7X4_9STRA|mmetsp:Transcript_27603/g.42255  ORF Transcript_27603/g.42255 Transcript_27603/m.42255 type:complete len:317 (+) Transcript_27603:154-1104(+)|eukprot:CAMPEP_0194085120 /NCGR_PEP_ID=MMETSP0149-20130528/16304_1 /TAXON_ID=122233 /ORGANISM="Chaetoceros debilis, Strain MM31A-1" /LENGTH=316 /DNA_ID=CAMNT_0038767935 /DNA_START=126 /DNA_END=1076 /DNA_ORIENTATION=+
MKVFLYYEDNDHKMLHKTLKITLPKSWKNGPTSKLLDQFVETYNASDLSESLTLNADEMHLAHKVKVEVQSEKTLTLTLTGEEELKMISLASDAITIETIEDREAVYIMHGKSSTLAEVQAAKQEIIDRKKEEMANTVACVRFGCKTRFPKGGPYPACCYHKAPPVFHETAKFWSCCPNKKAYDWEEFQLIKGCMTGRCTDVKDNEEEKQFLGGCDLRDALHGESEPLKSIDDFNKAQADGSDAAPVLQRLRGVMKEIGVENELFDQVLDGIRNEAGDGGGGDSTEEDELAAATSELGKKLKAAMKKIAVDQLRIK